MGRFIIIVLDSVGVGSLPDAARFGDEGANTLKHIDQFVGVLRLPHMKALGLYNIDGLGLEGVASPAGAFGRCAELSDAKDTITGHYEIAGLIVDKPFRVFPGGFPKEIVAELERRIGRGIIGNTNASGTEIIREMGDEHVRTGKPILYTSADSVMQIAMHEEVIPLKEQYRICETARELMMGDNMIARIICRPFLGEPGGYARTENRRDFALDPPGKTVLNLLSENGKDVIAVGKIEDIFNRSGITKVDHSKNNAQGVDAAVRWLSGDFDGLLFVNLVDFDMLYGHRNDAAGYARALEYFDSRLPELTDLMREDDILVITADHGCDPTYPGTDHTREYTPLLVAGIRASAGVNLGTRKSFADIAATAAEYFGLHWPTGNSFLNRAH